MMVITDIPETNVKYWKYDNYGKHRKTVCGSSGNAEYR